MSPERDAMQLSEAERSFLDKHKRLLRHWNRVGLALLALLGALAAWLFVKAPLLINPVEVLARLQIDAIEPSMLMLMAGFLPITVLGALLLMVVMIVFVFAAFATERRHLRIIDALLEARRGGETFTTPDDRIG